MSSQPRPGQTPRQPETAAPRPGSAPPRTPSAPYRAGQTPPPRVPSGASQRPPADVNTRLDGQRGWLNELEESLKKRSIIALVLTCLAVGAGAAAIYISVTKNSDADRITALETRIAALEAATGATTDPGTTTDPGVTPDTAIPPASGTTSDSGIPPASGATGESGAAAPTTPSE